MRPPGTWERLLGRLLPRELRDSGMGDAAEEFCQRARHDGLRAARRWYRRQVVRSLAPALRGAFEHRRAEWHGRSSRGEVITMWTKDLRLAGRVLLKRPGFTLTIVATLALGVGVTTALFGIFRAVFLEPLDLPDPAELVVVMEAGSFGCCGPASGPDYVDWVERSRSFDGMAVLSPRSFNVTGLDEAQRVYATAVSASAFDLLGVEAELGRFILPDDAAGGDVVVLGHGFWQRVFGARRDLLGEALEIDGAPHTIVGVMPRGFDVPSPWARTVSHQFYVPFPAEALQSGRGSHSYPVIARLAEGATVESAQADMDRVMSELATEYPHTNADRVARVFTVHAYLFGDIGRNLALVLAAAGLVLLIACANVASLQLARAAGRESELSVRTALGAPRRAIVRLLFSESLLLSGLGGGAGVLVSFVAVQRLRDVLPSTIPRVETIQIDAWALLFAITASVLTAFVFGMAPALVAARADLASGVKEGGYSTLAPRKERLRDYFIVGQIALGLVLANGAGLLVQSYATVRGQEYGFVAEGTLTLALSASGSEYDTESERQGFYETVAERVAGVPGVTSAGVVSKLPFRGGTNGHVQVAGRPPRTSADQGPLVEVSSVAGDYFEAMGIPLVMGRALEPVDSVAGAVGVIVNRHMTQEVWPGENPIGKQFGFADDPPWLTVVGVVGDVRQWGPEQEVLSEAYFPYSRGWSSGGYVVARTSGDPAALSGAIRAAMLEVDPTQPPSDIMAMSERVDAAFAQRRFLTTLIGLFAVAALLLAFAGIYGTVSYFVARRVRELGIRMALGAGGTGILGLVVRRGIRLAVWGVGIGLLGVWSTTSIIESLVYGIGATDVITLVVGCLALGLAAVAASALPAVRAVRVPPILALRSE